MARVPQWEGFLRLSPSELPVALDPVTSEAEKISFTNQSLI
jgi:non-homologous end joining protein Ku